MIAVAKITAVNGDTVDLRDDKGVVYTALSLYYMVGGYKPIVGDECVVMLKFQTEQALPNSNEAIAVPLQKNNSDSILSLIISNQNAIIEYIKSMNTAIGLSLPQDPSGWTVLGGGGGKVNPNGQYAKPDLSNVEASFKKVSDKIKGV